MINTPDYIVLPRYGAVHLKPQKTLGNLRSKSEIILHALKRKREASLGELCTITGWQTHSIRGHISGTIRKKKKLNVSSDFTKSGTRRYRLIEECSRCEDR